MRITSPNFDWSLFWLLQAIFLGVPSLIAVISFRNGPSLSHHRAAVLGFGLVALTVLNLIFFQLRAAVADRHRNQPGGQKKPVRSQRFPSASNSLRRKNLS
jgi:hypothetical protein